jgi:hypothetical protein
MKTNKTGSHLQGSAIHGSVIDSIMAESPMLNPTYDINKYSVLMPNNNSEEEAMKYGSSATLAPGDDNT